MKKGSKTKKKLKKPFKILLILIVLFLGIGCSLVVYFSFNKKEVDVPKKTSINKEVEKDTKKEYHVSMIMVGDALIHNSLYYDAKQSDGSYDFKPMLELTKPITSQYDLAYYNQETVLGGTELGLSSYPCFNSPQEVGDAFIDSGFNLVSLATNHTMDRGETAVLRSLEYWNSKKNVVTAGSYRSFEERDSGHIYEVNGIKYAFFSYTTWTNGLVPPAGKEYLDNIYSDELAKADIERVRDRVDVIMVAMHWGIEYSLGVSASQTEIANYLSSLGVDIIIGAHPHVVEPIEYIGKTLVIYSLGNYISAQDSIEKLTGLMVSVDINKTVDKGNTTIAIENPKAELIYTKYNLSGKANFKVYPYSQLNNTILPNYYTYYEKYKAIVTEKYPDLAFAEAGGA